jgi:hypothetical protein
MVVSISVASLGVVRYLPELAKKSVAILPWSDDPLETGLLMIWHREKWISPALKTFMGLMREALGKQGMRA